MKVIDDFLGYKEFQRLRSEIMSPVFDWNFVPMSDSIKEDPNKFSGQFVHLAYSNCVPRTTFFNNLMPVLSRLDATTLNRIKVNLQPRTEEPVEGMFHSDLGGDMDIETRKTWTTSVYYINTNNGYTEFEDGTKVESVENRMVKFSSDTLHRGVTCTDEQTRVVINFNYLPLYKG